MNRDGTLFFTLGGCVLYLRGCLGARLLPQSYQYGNLSEGADRVGGQLRGDKECPFSGVTKSGRVWRRVPESDVWRRVPESDVWRKVPESDAGSVGVTVSPSVCSDRREDIGVPAGEIPGGEAERGRGELPHLLLYFRRRPPGGPGGTVRSTGPQQIQVMHLVHCTT